MAEIKDRTFKDNIFKVPQELQHIKLDNTVTRSLSHSLSFNGDKWVMDTPRLGGGKWQSDGDKYTDTALTLHTLIDTGREHRGVLEILTVSADTKTFYVNIFVDGQNFWTGYIGESGDNGLYMYHTHNIGDTDNVFNVIEFDPFADSYVITLKRPLHFRDRLRVQVQNSTTGTSHIKWWAGWREVDNRIRGREVAL